jgi:spore coat protein CotH
VKPGPRIAVSDAPRFPDKGLYDPDILRTLFLQFEDKDWEAALGDFHGTDVEVPADLTVDGKTYPGVGVHFRGMSSYMMVREGHKRSLNVSIDFTDPKRRLGGYKTLNLLNSHEDPSFLHTVLYSRIANGYLPTPKANLVRVVINGESWGVYVNAQQFDKIFLAEHFPSDEGARWKVRGNPGADAGLKYVGDDVAEYERRYEMKSGGKSDWKALIELCRTLSETPTERLEAALGPILDLDGVLWFLALDNALINNDGYWTRASDYSLHRDPSGKFHLFPHDMNEAFGPAMTFGFGGPFGPGGRGPGGTERPGGPAGGRGGPRPSGVDLDPLIGLDKERTPLRGRLLAVPSLRKRYLEHVRAIANDWLDWKTLGPVVAGYRALIEKAVAEDTRKLSSLDAFLAAVSDSADVQPAPRGRPSLGLRAFADQRRAYLLGQMDDRGGDR